MTPQEEKERYRYLQLKAKMASASPEPSADIGNNLAANLKAGAKNPWSVGLKLPEKMASEGLNKISAAIPTNIFSKTGQPTGNLPLDLAGGAPKIAAETLAQTAPPFVSRGAIVTAGAMPVLRAARPVASMVRQGVFGQAENFAMEAKAKGALEAGYKDASTIFSKGRKAAQPLYEAAKKEIPEGTSIFKGMYKPEEILDKAQEYIKGHRSMGTALPPSDALMVRKAVDKLLGSSRYVKDELYALRDTFDELAKRSPNIAEADPLFKKGMQGEAMRKLLPQNLRGGTSRFNVAVGTALTRMGTPGKILSAGLSPAVWGTAATGLGVAERKILTPLMQNPKLAASVYAILKNSFESPQK